MGHLSRTTTLLSRALLSSQAKSRDCRFFVEKLDGKLDDKNFVAKPLPTRGKRKAESAVVEFNQLKAVPLRQTVLPLNPKDFDESIDHELTSQVHLLASSGIPCVPTRTCTLRYR